MQGGIAGLRAIDAMFAAIAERTPAIDVLVNNARRGSGGQPTLQNSTPEMLDKLMALNARAALHYLSRAAVPLLRGGGAKINLDSTVTRADAGAVAYVGKEATKAFTRSRAFERAERTVAVNANPPSLVLTDLVRDNMLPERINKRARAIPLGCGGEPPDVAGMFAFLAGQDAR